jgi:multicomponent Na+:H+ antiporter subunit D
MLERLLPLAVAVPLILAAALMPLSHIVPRRVADGLATLCALFVTVLCAEVAAATMQTPMHYWFGGWTPSHGIALGIEFAPDPIGAGLGAFAALLVGLAFAFSWWYFESAGTLFHVLMLVFLAAMVGFALTGDIFNLFVFFELMSVAAFALTGFKIEEKKSIEGAINFAITNSLGAFLVLIGIALLYGRTGALNMTQIGTAVAHVPPDALLVVSFTLLLAGFCVKGAVVPFHMWLDDAHAVAPTPLCVLFSGVMVQLALYAVARIFWQIYAVPFHGHEEPLRLLLVVMGTLTALVGGLMAFNQRHIKRMLAFSTISHSGMFICGLATFSVLGIAAAAIFVVAHGFVKAALFMSSGILLQRTGSVDAAALRGRGRSFVALGILFVAGGLLLAGLPPFGVAAGKELLDSAMNDAHLAWLPIIFGIASALDGGAVLRAGGSIFLGLGRAPQADDEATTHSEKRETEDRPQRTPVTMLVTAFFSLALVLVLPLDRPIVDGVQKAASIFLHGMPFAVKPAITLRGSLIDVAVTLGAIGVAVVALYSPPRKAFAAPINALRSIHSGVFTDYVVWIITGVAVYGAFLIFSLR